MTRENLMGEAIELADEKTMLHGLNTGNSTVLTMSENLDIVH